ncbi:MAG: RluA family pseudouridine synthase, partial [Smithellaceae bacterium]|nr:RluA family pseudouridine synthase [Smithellaceae bacterium]
EGDVVVFSVPAPAASDLVAQDIPLSIIYEDASLLVIDKPAGIVVHPAPGHPEGTIVNAILHHCDDLCGIGGVQRPGIVHRLDKDTSGLLVVAKTDQAHRSLTEQFKSHQVRKTYLTLVVGDPREDDGVIDLPVGRHPVDRKKMSTLSRRGREALSRWRVKERFGRVSLLEVDIETGRTHQIRVHLSAAGYPVVGDSVYGGTKRAAGIEDVAARNRLKAFKRQALHAARLGFSHPVSGKELSFVSPLPEDMTELCAFLRDRAVR